MMYKSLRYRVARVCREIILCGECPIVLDFSNITATTCRDGFYVLDLEHHSRPSVVFEFYYVEVIRHLIKKQLRTRPCSSRMTYELQKMTSSISWHFYYGLVSEPTESCFLLPYPRHCGHSDWVSIIHIHSYTRFEYSEWPKNRKR